MEIKRPTNTQWSYPNWILSLLSHNLIFSVRTNLLTFHIVGILICFTNCQIAQVNGRSNDLLRKKERVSKNKSNLIFQLSLYSKFDQPSRWPVFFWQLLSWEMTLVPVTTIYVIYALTYPSVTLLFKLNWHNMNFCHTHSFNDSILLKFFTKYVQWVFRKAVFSQKKRQKTVL